MWATQCCRAKFSGTDYCEFGFFLFFFFNKVFTGWKLLSFIVCKELGFSFFPTDIFELKNCSCCSVKKALGKRFSSWVWGCVCELGICKAIQISKRISTNLKFNVLFSQQVRNNFFHFEWNFTVWFGGKKSRKCHCEVKSQ